MCEFCPGAVFADSFVQVSEPRTAAETPSSRIPKTTVISPVLSVWGLHRRDGSVVVYVAGSLDQADNANSRYQETGNGLVWREYVSDDIEEIAPELLEAA